MASHSEVFLRGVEESSVVKPPGRQSHRGTLAALLRGRSSQGEVPSLESALVAPCVQAIPADKLVPSIQSQDEPVVNTGKNAKRNPVIDTEPGDEQSFAEGGSPGGSPPHDNNSSFAAGEPDEEPDPSKKGRQTDEKVIVTEAELSHKDEINPDSSLAKLRTYPAPPDLTDEEWDECEQHFRTKHYVGVNGDTVTYVVIPPLREQQNEHMSVTETLEGREETVNTEQKLTLFIAPGWSETAALMKEALFRYAKMGYKVVTLDHARKVSKKDLETSDRDFEAEWAEVLKANAIVSVVQDVMEGQDDKRLGIVTHSEGTINGSLAAERVVDEGIADLVAIHIDSGATLNGPHSFWTYAYRGLKLFAQGEVQAIGDIKEYILAVEEHIRLHPDTLPKVAGHFFHGTRELIKGLRQFTQGETHAIRSASEAGKLNSLLLSMLGYMRSNPRLAIDEVLAIAHENAAPTLLHLAKMGVPIFQSHGPNDVLIPLNEVQEHAILRDGEKAKRLDEKYGHGDIGYLKGFIVYGKDPRDSEDDVGDHLSLNTQPRKVVGISDYFFSRALEWRAQAEEQQNPANN